MIHITNSSGATILMPVSMSWQKVSSRRSVASERLSTDGSVFTGSTKEPLDFSLVGTYCFGDPVENRHSVDELQRFLFYEPIEVSRDNGATFISAYVTAFEMDGMDGDAEILLDIGFTATDPFFYGGPLEESKSFDTAGTMEVVSQGNTRGFPVVTMTITGTVTDPKISCGGLEVLCNGTYGTGEIVVDNKKMTSDFNGSGIFTAMSSKWAVGGFSLLPESQQVAFSGSGVYTVVVKLEWRPRYRR